MSLENMHDIRSIKYPDVFQDFEGVTGDAKEVLMAFKTLNGWMWDFYCEYAPPEIKAMLRSIVLNIVTEHHGDIGAIPTEEEAWLLCHTVSALLMCPRWSRVTDEMIDKIMKGGD